jgi:Dehydrogenases with different specificities (related to short-chain alcohol dehydrogenases)
MAARGFGRVVNITSSSVKAPIDVLGLSNGARSGLTGFVAGVARSKLAAQGVTINNLLPGVFDTDRVRSMTQATSQKTGQPIEVILHARRKNIPAQRFGTPKNSAPSAPFCAAFMPPTSRGRTCSQTAVPIRAPFKK